MTMPNTQRFVKWALSKSNEEHSTFTCDQGNTYSVVEKQWSRQIGSRARKIVQEIGTGTTLLINEDHHHQKITNLAKYRSQYGSLLVCDTKYNLVATMNSPESKKDT